MVVKTTVNPTKAKRGRQATTKQTASKLAPRKLAQRREQKTSIFYALGLALWVGAATIVSQIIVGFVMSMTVGSEMLVSPVGTAIFSASSYLLDLVLILIPPIALAKRRKKQNDKSTTKVKKTASDDVDIPETTTANNHGGLRAILGLKGLPTWTDIGLAPIGYVAYLLLAWVLMLLFTLFPWFNAEEAQDVGFNFTIMGVDRLIAFFTLVIIAPIAEEIVFRGWLYGKLRRRFTENFSERVGLILAMLIVSVVFGIVHLQWNVGVNVFALSIVLCGLREFTGTIYSGILLHMLKNGIAFYLLYVVGI